MSANKKPKPDRDRRQHDEPDGPPAGDGLGVSEQAAIDDDQRHEQPEHFVQLVEHGVRQQVERRHERGEEQQIQRYPHGRQQHAAQQRHRGVRDDEHGGGHDAEREPVDERRADGQQRAQAEQLNERHVVAPQAGRCFAERISRVHRRRHRRLRQLPRHRARHGVARSIATCS